MLKIYNLARNMNDNTERTLQFGIDREVKQLL
jgi:hypothetical protein